MSYCRWSSDNFGCDLYIYEHVAGGWATHVAGNRVVGEVPKVPPIFGDTDADEWAAAYRAQMDFLKTAKREPIGLPHDGETFYDDTAADCLARFDQLRAMGYRAPDYARESLEEEVKATRQEGAE